MPPPWSVCLAALLPLALLALPRPTAEELSARSAGELLALPIRAAPGSRDEGPRPPLWRALLDSPAAERRGSELVLRLGEVRADPTPARLSALQAGELLRLPAEGDPSARPLWRVILDGPAVERTPDGLVLRLYGCRHSADPRLAPVLEDTYVARLSFADTLASLAREHPQYSPLVIEGRETPVKGGANFEVQLIGDQHMVAVTVDETELEPVYSKRLFRAVTPNDTRLRESLARGLEEAARATADGAALRIEGRDSPAENGVGFRLEYLGALQTLVATGAGSPLSVRRPWAPANPGLPLGLAPWQLFLAGTILALAPLAWGCARRRGLPEGPEGRPGGPAPGPAAQPGEAREPQQG